MEALVEFMYMGVASFYQDRMNEFIKVAKDLEIKDISKNFEFANISEVSTCEEINVEFAEVVAPEEEITKIENNFESLESYEVWEEENDEQKNEGNFHDIAQSTPQTLVKKFFCNKCDYEASFKHNLARHMQVHEGIKHACNQCKYQTSFPSDLKNHIKSKHEGVTYACHQCDSKFTAKKNLTAHIKSIHLGGIFKCNECDTQFNSRSGLANHAMTKHTKWRFEAHELASNRS